MNYTMTKHNEFISVNSPKMLDMTSLNSILRQSEQKKHFVIEKASIDPIFLKDNENFRNLKFNVAIWFEEECSFKPMKEGGFILHKPRLYHI